MTQTSKKFKNVLVTGGNGFIGYNLAKKLLSNGHKVTINDVAPLTNKEELFCNTELSDTSSYLSGLQLASSMPNIFPSVDKYDVIYHLAATPRVAISLIYPEHVLKNNINTLIDVLGYCRQNPLTKLVFISSSSVVWTDTSKNPYAASKKIGEELVNIYRNTFGVQATSVRLFNVYGPGESNYGESTTLLKRCKNNFLLKQPFTVHGDGSQVRDFTHIDDVTAALLLIMNEYKNSKEIYEVGGSNPTSVLDIINMFVAHAENKKIIYAPTRFADATKTMADENLKPAKWKPTRTLENYINDWIRAGAPDD